MMTKNNFRLTLAALSAAAFLAACGGGGGGGNTTSTPSTPATGSSSPSGSSGNLQTTVPTASYASGSAKATVFAQLNAYRSAMGVGLLKQDPLLDNAADFHALYLVNNLANGNITALSHDENSAFPNYYEATPLSRARKAGVPSTEWVAENAAANLNQATDAASGLNCLNQWLNTVYHLQGATGVSETAGIGFQTNTAQGTFGCVLDMGETTNVVGTPIDNGVYGGGGQQMATNAIAVSPTPNEANVATAMVAETPNPAPDLAKPGRPIMLRVNASAPGDSLTVSSFTLTVNGAQVPARIIVPAAAMSGSTGATADVNNNVFTGVAFLLPLAPLTPNTTYTVSFSGQRDGTPITKTWTFATGS
jgi:uncharacterized protein YkwD